MKATLLFILFLSYSLLSLADDCDLNPVPQLETLVVVAHALEWRPATDADVKNAYCARKSPYTDDEMNNWIKDHQGPQNISKTINGIKFENESYENLEVFKHLTTPFNILGIDEPEKAKKLTSTCTKVDCALKEIFGDTSVQLQFMSQKFGFNGSHLTKPNSVPWKKENLDIALLAMSDYPEGILPLQSNKQFIHSSSAPDDKNTLANASITIFDGWDNKTPEYKRETILHEIGHNIANETNLDNSPRWMKESGWTASEKMIDGKEKHVSVTAKPQTMISDYGQTNEWEDLAESVVAYRYNPQHLKDVSPEKYETIKKLIFDNVEYTSKDACENPQRLSSALARRVSQKINTWVPSNEQLKEISNHCSDLAIKNFAKEGQVSLSNPDFDACYKKAVMSYSLTLMKNENAGDPDLAFLSPILKNANIEISPEKLRSLTVKLREAHAKTIKNSFRTAMTAQFFCNERFLQYAGQGFKDKDLGVQTYYLSGEFTEIAKKTCKRSQHPATLLNKLVK